MQEVAEFRQRERTRTRSAQTTAHLLGGGFVVIAVALVLDGQAPTPWGAALMAAMVALYAVAFRTEFVSTAGSAVPTEPILVGLCLTIPVHLVPLAVLIGLQLGAHDSKEGDTRLESFVLRSVNGWHCLGPVAVLAACATGPPSAGNWPVYLLALLAQFVVDGAVASLRAWTNGVSPRRLVGPLSWTFTIDGLLAPIGACITLTAGPTLGLVVLSAAPIVLVRLLAGTAPSTSTRRSP